MKAKKIMAAIIAVTTMAISMNAVSTSASNTTDTWEVSCVTVPGASSGDSKIDYPVVYHKQAGVNAYCNSNTHTNTSAVTGYTKIECVTYSMDAKTITNTGSKICMPNVGEPNVDIYVKYKVSATTPYSNDIFWSKGTLVKRGQ